MKKTFKKVVCLFLLITTLVSSAPLTQAAFVENVDGTHVGILENWERDNSTSISFPFVSKITVDGKDFEVKKALFKTQKVNNYKGKEVIFVVTNGEVTKLSLLSELTTTPTISIESFWDSNKSKEKRNKVEKLTYSNGRIDRRYMYIGCLIKNAFSSKNNTWDYEFLKSNDLFNLEDISVTLKSNKEDLLYFLCYDNILPYKSNKITFTLDEIVAAGGEYEFLHKIYVNKDYTFDRTVKKEAVEIECEISSATSNGKSRTTFPLKTTIEIINNDYGKILIDTDEIDIVESLNKLYSLSPRMSMKEQNKFKDIKLLVQKLIVDESVNKLSANADLLDELKNIGDIVLTKQPVASAFHAVLFEEIKEKASDAESKLREMLGVNMNDFLNHPDFNAYIRWCEEELKEIEGIVNGYENKCPTDINVVDDDDVTVLSIINNKIEICDETIYAFVIEDEKYFYLPTDMEHTITVTATDNGTMDYNVTEYTPGGLERTISYYDVPLVKGETYTAIAPLGRMNAADEYNLIAENGDEIKYDHDSLPPSGNNIVDVVVAEELFDNFSIELIDKVANAMFNFEPVVDIMSYNISTKDTVALFSAISKYYPTEYSLITKGDFKYKIIFSPSLGCITEIRFYYGDDANREAFEQRNNELKSEINKIVGLVEGKDDFEKALFIHDYIVLNSEYDLELLEILESGGLLSGDLYSEKYSEYSILINGTGVCGSYALAYRALMNAAGVDCLYLSSFQMGHAWNLVKIDGEWYHVDCCWDDPVPDIYGNARRTFFLRTDEEIMELEHYSWIPGTYKATSTLYSNMPRYSNYMQKYDSDNWYILDYRNIIKTSRHGENEEEIVDFINASSIDFENGELYYSLDSKIYKYNFHDKSSEIIFSIPEAKNSDGSVNVRNFYYDNNLISYYGIGYDEEGNKMHFKGVSESQKSLYDAVSGITLNNTYFNLQVFDETTIDFTIISEKPTEELVVEWSSSSPDVATVDGKGRIIAKKGGETTITAKVGPKAATCVVSVEVNEYKGFCDGNTKWFFDTGTQTMYIYPYEKNTCVRDIYMYAKEREVVKHVVVTEGIKAIEGTFQNWRALETVELNEDLEQIKADSFNGCIALETVDIPDSVERIGRCAFSNCTSLKEVTIGKKVNYIGFSAFYMCSSLETVNYNAINCSDVSGYLGLLTYSKNLSSPFIGCTLLSQFNIAQTVELVDCKLFITNKNFNNYDSSLTEINIPDSVKTIEATDALHSCYKLTEISVDSNNLNYEDIDGVLFCKSTKTLVKYPIDKKGSTYTMPDEYETIADSAFWKNKHIEEIILSDDVITVGVSAFEWCEELKKVYIGTNVSNMTDTKFVDCVRLSEINVSSQNTVFASKDGVLFNKDFTELIEYPEGNKREEYSVPNGVANFSEYSFCYNPYLKVLKIPDSVTDIKNTEFSGYESLAEFIVAENNLIYSSVNGVLFNKEQTTLIEYPQGNSRKMYSVPSKVTSISDKAFSDAVKLERIDFSDDVNEIGSCAFSGCYSLQFCSIPKNVTVINRGTFINCKNLETMVIPDKISKIDYDSFEYCSELKRFLVLNPSCEFGAFEDGDNPDIGLVNGCVIYGYSGSTAETYANDNNLTFVDIEATPHEHAYFLSDYIPKENGMDGVKHYKCYCDDSGYDEADHQFGEEYSIVGNCLDGALKEYTCSVCGHKERETLEPTEHLLVLELYVPGTCIDPGKEIYKCSVCQYTEEKMLDSDDCHSYTETLTAPTCTEIGYTTATCEHCGENAMYDFVPMLGHDVTVTHTDADCKKCAQTEYSCSRCDYHEIIVDEESGLGEHKISVTVTEATCTENGSIDRICVTCNELFSTEVVASNGHIPGEWETATDATTESAGKKEKRCIVCKELVEEEEIPKIPVNVTGILLSESEIEISNKGTHLLTATVSPENADDRTVTWISDDPSVATVDENGLVTAVSIGETTVSVTTTDGGYTVSCAVTVIPREFDITWVVGGNKTVETYKEGSLLKKPSDPVRTGYTFTGWTPEVPDIMPAEDLTFTAVFESNTYNAIFDANGGKWADGTAKKTVPTAFDSQIAAPEAPIKQGYIFSKWSPEVGVMDSVDGKRFVAEWIAATDTRYTVETYTMNTSGEYVKTTKAFNGTTGESISVKPTVQTGFTLNKSKSVLSGNVAADNSLVLKVYIDRNTYTLTTVADGVSTSTRYLYGSLIAEPATPVKTGYKFIKWDKTLPETMPAKNITLTAVFDTAYTCPDCGDEIVGESAIAEHIAAEARAKSTVSIKNNPETKTIKYGETLRLTAIASKPDDVVICWYVDGAKKGEGTTFDLKFERGTKTVEVKLEDADGNAVYNSSGAEISDSEEVTVNAGFFQKIISFFKNLFRMDRTVIQ